MGVAMLLNPYRRRKRNRAPLPSWKKAVSRLHRRRAAEARQADDAALGAYTGFTPGSSKRRRSRKSRRSKRRFKTIKAWKCKRVSKRVRAKNSSFNYRRRRNGSSWIPAYANPSAIMSAARSGFDVNKIKAALPVVGGFFGYRYVHSFLANLGFVPSFLKTGIGDTVLRLLSAGAMSAAVGLVARQYAGPVLLGSVIDVVRRVADQYLMPILSYTPLAGLADLSDLGDDELDGMEYFSVENFDDAQPLSGMGDYLTVANARGARPLNGMDALSVRGAANAIPVSDMLPELVPGGDIEDQTVGAELMM